MVVGYPVVSEKIPNRHLLMAPVPPKATSPTAAVTIVEEVNPVILTDALVVPSVNRISRPTSVETKGACPVAVTVIVAPTAVPERVIVLVVSVFSFSNGPSLNSDDAIVHAISDVRLNS